MQKKFGNRLRDARKAAYRQTGAAYYKTGADFARILGVSEPAYRKYERGQSLPPLDVLERIRDLTTKSLDFLLLGKRESHG